MHTSYFLSANHSDHGLLFNVELRKGNNGNLAGYGPCDEFHQKLIIHDMTGMVL